ncbi:GATA zinc finger domain-containing protein 9-like [Telopea speciosissima]|uniref:GATA zinc finger domain-containing protein 9-like n=1 Tax=Telopea speciosissima TaxID=54955 RepID=UPI001CC772B9|nr:GATA zinc finger domain-containing protein 9-like [Telopea speciosissima]
MTVGSRPNKGEDKDEDDDEDEEKFVVVGNNHGSDGHLCSADVSGDGNGNGNNNTINGFIDCFGGSPSLAPPHLRPPNIPILSAQYYNGNKLCLAPSKPIVNVSPMRASQQPNFTEPHSGDSSEIVKRCAFCGKTETPLWRNGPNGRKTLCNACGIRFKKQEKKAQRISEPYLSPKPKF